MVMEKAISIVKNHLGKEYYIPLRDKLFEISNGVKRKFQKSTFFARSLPEFIIIGAMKSGTTSLYYYLSKHPRVLPPIKKEIHYFDHNYHKGDIWYKSHFPITLINSNRFITGESSPYYLFHPNVPDRISETVPGAKLIVILRDPAERAISHYWHKVKSNKESRTIREALNWNGGIVAEEEQKLKNGEKKYSYEHVNFSYLERGKYVQQIDRYTDSMDEENILILKSEDLFENTESVMDSVYDFLEIESFHDTRYVATNCGDYRTEINSEILLRLSSYFREHNEELNKKYGIKFE